jgi:hypothetical protein
VNNAEQARTSAERRWPLFLAGVLLCVLGPVAYFVQLQMHLLWMPWYVPALCTAGVALMMVSLLRRPGIWRCLVVAVFALLCASEWFMVLIGGRTPVYAGPAMPGHKLPAFAARLADGTPFTDSDLAKGVPTVLVFFRGRW